MKMIGVCPIINTLKFSLNSQALDVEFSLNIFRKKLSKCVFLLLFQNWIGPQLQFVSNDGIRCSLEC